MTDGFPYKLAAILNTSGLNFTWYNSGVSSQTVADMNLDANTELYNKHVGKSGAFKRNHFISDIEILFGGTNDLFFGADEITTRSRQAIHHAASRTAGAKTIHISMIKRNQSGLPATFENDRVTNNTYWVSQVGNLIDCYCDIATLIEFSDTSNTTYYQDGIHPTALGNTLIANTLSNSILQLF